MQPVGQRADEGLRLRVDLGQVVVLPRGLDRRPQCVGTSTHSAARSSCSVTPRSCHAGLAHQQLHRHRVEHLVADHHAAHALGQLARPTARLPKGASACCCRSRRLAESSTIV
jgi:hypothetical protein